MRVAIVNDMALATETLRRIVQSRGDLEVAWTAADGADAVERCRSDRPDLILMDMIMPVVDGVEATRRIMRECPCAILVVTATVDGNAGKVFEALGHGAVDAVQTPTVGRRGELHGAEDLLRKIEHVRLVTGSRAAPAAPVARPRPAAPALHGSALAIGASTGGPQAIALCLGALPRPVTYPILIVQHLGVEFVVGFADWLAKGSHLPVRLVRERGRPEAGAVHLAALAHHLVAFPNGDIGVVEEPRDHLHKPSVDVLFESLVASDLCGVAVLLTGMGRDGAQGLLSLRNAGWWTIAQDERSSVVWGMPGEAVRIGAACETLAVGAIGAAVAAGFARTAARGHTRRGGMR